MSWIFGITANAKLNDKYALIAKNNLPAKHKLIERGNHLVFFDDHVNLLFSESAGFIARGFGIILKKIIDITG